MSQLNLIDLQALLSDGIMQNSGAQAGDFILDDRTLATRLSRLKEYCAKMPFDVENDTTWADVFFISDVLTGKVTPESLAQLYHNVTQADGNMLPHQAFLLAFFRMLETPQALFNSFPARHRQLYYRDLLGLKERPLVPDRVVLTFKLSGNIPELPISAGLQFDGGQDSQGASRQYQLEQSLMLNHARWTDLRWRQPPSDGSGGWEVERVVYDEQNKIPWPKQGVRLFHYNDDLDKAVVIERSAFTSPDSAVESSRMKCIVNKWPSALSDLPEPIKITAPSPQARAYFGTAVSASADGCILAVGAEGSQRVYVYHRNNPGWETQPDILEGESGFEAGFGAWVSLSANGRQLIVRQGFENLFLYEYNDETLTWDQQKKFTAPNGDARARGVSFSADGSTLAVGKVSPVSDADPDTDPDADPETYSKFTPGEVYVYRRQDDWQTPTILEYEETKSFGRSVSLNIDGTILAVGVPANREVLIFDDDWEKPIRLAYDDLTALAMGVEVKLNAAGNQLVARSDDGTVVVTSYREFGKWSPLRQVSNVAGKEPVYEMSCQRGMLVLGNKDANNSVGAAYISTFCNGRWSEKIDLAVEGEDAQRFGSVIDLSVNGCTLMVGAYAKTVDGKYGAGTVYIFKLAEPPEATRQLYLGFQSIELGQTLNLHLQLESTQAFNIKWEYLSVDNGWRSLSYAVNDATGGLFYSGLWSSTLPKDAGIAVSGMPTGRYWIRGLLQPIHSNASNDFYESEQNVAHYPWLQGLNCNSATALLSNGEALESAHFDHPLPAGSVKRAVVAVSGLAAVLQPWPSTGGRSPESESAFLQRAAQRLKHRGRALTWQDVQALLRNRYPDVQAIRIPSPETLSQSRYPQSLVVIPAIGQMVNANPLKPEFNLPRLREMESYLSSLASPWQSLSLSNPDYIDVEVVYEIAFCADTNSDYGYHQLRLALEHKYMPWSWDGSSITLGYRLDYYDMVSFIQALPWVERVITLTLNGEPESVVSSETEVLILTAFTLPATTTAVLKAKPTLEQFLHRGTMR